VRARDPESRYREKARHEQKILEDYAAHEIRWAEDLLVWYRIKRKEVPDDEYRTAAFFINRQYLSKPGSLTLLYQSYKKLTEDLPEVTKENAFDLLAYRFRLYARVLEKGGFS
jgi:hypothetical protein